MPPFLSSINNRPIEKMVSLAPSHTEILFALGLGEKVVGVTENCDYPPEVKDKKRIGFFAHPYLPQIISLRPDLVFTYGQVHKGCTEALQTAGITVVNFIPRTIEELLQGMELIAGINGEDKAGHELVSLLKEKVKKIKARTASFLRPRVFFLMSEEPLATPGSASCQYDTLYTAGAYPFPLADEAPFALLSWEDVVRYDPEIIVACGRENHQPPKKRCPGCQRKIPLCSRNIEDIKSYPPLKKVKAVQTGRIYSLSCENICRPGPRLIEGLEKLSILFGLSLNDKKY